MQRGQQPVADVDKIETILGESSTDAYAAVRSPSRAYLVVYRVLHTQL